MQPAWPLPTRTPGPFLDDGLATPPRSPDVVELRRDHAPLQADPQLPAPAELVVLLDGLLGNQRVIATPSARPAPTSCARAARGPSAAMVFGSASSTVNALFFIIGLPPPPPPSAWS